jgi:hypothetical protein
MLRALAIAGRYCAGVSAYFFAGLVICARRMPYVIGREEREAKR